MKLHVTLVTAVGLLVAQSCAMWNMSCHGTLVRERIDPVIEPGIASSHVHRVVGGSGINFTMDFDVVRHANCSSCTVREDMSNYWVPQLYFRSVAVDGGDKYRIAPDGPVNIVYEQIRGTGPQAHQKIHAFPDDLQMAAGIPFRRNFTGDAMSEHILFTCPDNPSLGEFKSFAPEQRCTSIKANVYFPSCWNGKDRKADDFFSHMSYHNDGDGNCPDTHPVRVISMRYEFTFDTSDCANLATRPGWGTPLVFAQGDPTGFGFHGVFFNGWNQTALSAAIDTCTDVHAGEIASSCPVLSEFCVDECQRCKVPPRVHEGIDGPLPSLPGCNPVRPGPDEALPIPHCAAPGISPAEAHAKRAVLEPMHPLSDDHQSSANSGSTFEQWPNPVTSVRNVDPRANGERPFIGYKVCAPDYNAIDPTSSRAPVTCLAFQGHRAEAVGAAFVDWARDRYGLAPHHQILVPVDVVDALEQDRVSTSDYVRDQRRRADEAFWRSLAFFMAFATLAIFVGLVAYARGVRAGIILHQKRCAFLAAKVDRRKAGRPCKVELYAEESDLLDN